MPTGSENFGTYKDNPVIALIFEMKNPEYLNIKNIPTSTTIERIKAHFAFLVPLNFSIVKACL